MARVSGLVGTGPTARWPRAGGRASFPPRPVRVRERNRGREARRGGLRGCSARSRGACARHCAAGRRLARGRRGRAVPTMTPREPSDADTEPRRVPRFDPPLDFEPAPVVTDEGTFGHLPEPVPDIELDEPGYLRATLARVAAWLLVVAAAACLLRARRVAGHGARRRDPRAGARGGRAHADRRAARDAPRRHRRRRREPRRAAGGAGGGAGLPRAEREAERARGARRLGRAPARPAAGRAADAIYAQRDGRAADDAGRAAATRHLLDGRRHAPPVRRAELRQPRPLRRTALAARDRVRRAGRGRRGAGARARDGSSRSAPRWSAPRRSRSWSRCSCAGSWQSWAPTAARSPARSPRSRARWCGRRCATPRGSRSPGSAIALPAMLAGLAFAAAAAPPRPTSRGAAPAARRGRRAERARRAPRLALTG